ncbi:MULTISPECIES: DUF805 domain-containing protein [Kribbella]|uniref:Uncharacterized membrane protein YhaH (DUF805 family) n=1 Tax=Kribbella pratensis TaxID=2512112 RepID=A0ABY2FC49_9ACTN|nr:MULTISPECIES: DUF805 domain-containing protein [Kribbella]TDW88059.1 uncharacterized membrane protein YhaH (DUF805 family) [Kribbella pratensis]TDW88728.1 uncharacterized membrane protein YhaH (DUF805 family) [Kribbella sp. VKM Ac-2566]
MTWFITALRKYAVFNGRARRKEYWYFVLVTVIIGAGLLRLLDVVLGLTYGRRGTFGILQTLWWLGTLLPTIAVSVRRLHDTNRTGWWWLIHFVPVVGTIVYLVFAVQPGTAASNRYGADPKGGLS